MTENSQGRSRTNPKYIKKVLLGEGNIGIEEFVAVARYIPNPLSDKSVERFLRATIS